MSLIKEALKEMLKCGEFEKIIKYAKGRDKANAKEFYETIKDFDDSDFEKVPAIVFVKACRSWNVWADIYCFIEIVAKKEE